MSYWETDSYIDQMKRNGLIFSPASREKTEDAIRQAMEDAYHMGTRVGLAESNKQARAEAFAAGEAKERNRCAEIVRQWIVYATDTPSRPAGDYEIPRLNDIIAAIEKGE
jgi:hypothetical protein